MSVLSARTARQSHDAHPAARNGPERNIDGATPDRPFKSERKASFRPHLFIAKNFSKHLFREKLADRCFLLFG